LGYPNKPIWFAIGKLQGIEMEQTFKAGKPTTHEMGRNGRLRMSNPKTCCYSFHCRGPKRHPKVPVTGARTQASTCIDALSHQL